MVKKQLLSLPIVIFIITSFLSTPVSGAQVAGQSATLSANSVAQVAPAPADLREQKKKVILTVLKKYDSPLVDSVDTFVDVCIKYNLNCYLVPSIAGVESTFGRFILGGSFNPFGWGGGMILFKNWDEAIETVSQGLRNNYIGRGASTVEEVGAIYAASPTWSAKVRHFMAEFERVEAEQKQLQSKPDVVQL